MHKVITIFLFSAIISTAVYAQKTGDIVLALNTGTGSSDVTFDGFQPGFILGPDLKNYTPNRYSGAFFFTAKYFVSKRVAIGITCGYENESGGWQKEVDNGGAYDWEAVQLGTFKRQAFTTAVEADFTYMNRKLVRLYSVVGIGVTYENEIDTYDNDYYNSQYYNGINQLGQQQVANNRTHLNGYYAPLGVSIGNKVRWFLELGIGYKGFINTGISVKL